MCNNILTHLNRERARPVKIIFVGSICANVAGNRELEMELLKCMSSHMS